MRIIEKGSKFCLPDLYSSPFLVAYLKPSSYIPKMKASYKILIFVLLSSALALPASAVVHVPTGNWTVIPGPGLGSAGLKSITFSTNYLWGIDNRTITRQTRNIHYCQCPCRSANSWKSSLGQLDQTIDANEAEVWGINDRYQIYKRPINASSGWVQITGTDHFSCGGKCFSDVSVSNNGYIWAISRENETYILCHQGGVGTRCGNSENNRRLIDNELSLVHIEADDEEVWAVNSTNHIFKRPVNGSGEWSIVPGEMRYISASGNAHIWGIAPNNSLYVCEKQCTGDWQYVGGSFRQIEGGNNSVIGVTTDYTLYAMSLQGPAVTPITTLTESIQVDMNIPTAAEISTADVSPQYSGTLDPMQSTPQIPVSVSSTENMTPRVAKTTDSAAITVFPMLTLLTTTITSTELSTTPIAIVPGALTTTVRGFTEIAGSVKANTLPGVIIGVVTGMAVFSITLLLLVPLSIAVIVNMYARKLKKVKDRRRAVVITEYGIHGMEAIEMQELDFQGDPVYDSIDDTFIMPLKSSPGRKLTATRSCTDFSCLDDDIEKNIAYALTDEIVTSSEFEVNPAYITFSPTKFIHHAGVHGLGMQRSQSCPTLVSISVKN